MKTEVSPFRALLLAAFLLGLGFFIGLGFQSRAYQNTRQNAATPNSATPNGTSQGGTQATPTPTTIPLIKALQSDPGGKKLAFTGVYDEGNRAGIWIFETQTRRAHFTPSPFGWQDFVNSWTSDGRALLVEREKIPRPVAQAEAGIYRVPVENARASENGESLMPILPRGERLISGFRGGDGRLYLKTRREPKRIFRVEGENVTPLDSSSQNYGQNRVVLRAGQPSLLVVKNVGESENLALFRVQNGQSKQISPSLGKPDWSYVSLRGNYLLTATQESENWRFTLYRIGQRAQKLRSGLVPLDVISVYWSPDEKHVLGAAGENLWLIEIPSLKYRRLGTRTDWNADDAAWLGNQKTVAIAAQGALWRVEVPDGKATLWWKFPPQPWN